MIDIIGLYEGAALQATYAGIGFWMVDSRDEAGRRLLRFLFPGQDLVQSQDLGLADGTIAITGLYVGDDYQHVAARLRAAFRSPGPATLLHPWLGEILVEQAPGRLASFSFRHDDLRVVRFTATFCFYTPPQPPAPDTLTDLLDALEDLRTQATVLLATVLAPIAVTLMAVGYVERFAGSIAITWQTLVGNAQDPTVAAAAVAPIAALGVVDALPVDGTYPTTVAAALGAPSAAIGATSTPVMQAAVAPGGSLTPPTPVDGRVTAGLMLSALATIATKASDGPPGPTVATAAQMLVLADAVSAAADIGFTSQQEALQWQGKLNAALDAAAAQAAFLAAAQPTAAGAAWRALVAAKAALAADMTATIGRLPAVTTFVAPSSVSVWLLAHYLAGDTPGQVVATYLDLVARNGIVHPAIAPAGALEVLAVPGLTLPVPQAPTPLPGAAALPATAPLDDFVLDQNALG